MRSQKDWIVLRPSEGSRTGTVFLCSSGRRLHPGDVIKPTRGLVYLKPPSALLDHEEWPPVVYELEPLALVVHGELVARTDSARVVREVQLAETMGPHVADYIAFLEELGVVTWLAPREPVALTDVEQLVAEHYSELAAFGSVKPAPVRLVSTLDSAQHTFGRSDETPLSAAAMRRAMSPDYPDETSFPLVLAEHTAVRRPVAAIFKAAWTRAVAEHLGAVASQGQSADRVANILRKGEGPGLRATRAVVERTMVRDESLEPVLHRVLETPAFFSRDDRERKHQAAVWFAAMNVVNSATQTASAIGGAVLLGLERDPWRPLLELFKLGTWPVGEAGGEFVVYVPSAAS